MSAYDDAWAAYLASMRNEGQVVPGESVAGSEGYYGPLGVITGGQGVGASSENAAGQGWSGQNDPNRWREPIRPVKRPNNTVVITAPAKKDPVLEIIKELLSDGMVLLTATTSRCPDTTSYLWTVNGVSSAKNPAMFQLPAGTHEIKLAAKSPDYASFIVYKYDSIDVTINARTPHFTYVVQGTLVRFIWDGNYSTWGNANIRWDFGDGSAIEYGRTMWHRFERGTWNVTASSEGLSYSESVSIDVDIVLTWTDNSNNETGFNVYHSYDNVNWTLIQQLPAGTTSTAIGGGDGVDSSRLSYFRVTAYNAGGESSPTSTSVYCGNT